MLSTAMGILEVSKDSMFDDEIMALAGELHSRRNELDDKTFATFLFAYSTALTAKVADQVTRVCLTPEQYDEMVKTANEFEEISENIYEELGE